MRPFTIDIANFALSCETEKYGSVYDNAAVADVPLKKRTQTVCKKTNTTGRFRK